METSTNQNKQAALDFAVDKLDDAIVSLEELQELVGQYDREFDFVLDNLYAAKRAVQMQDEELEDPDMGRSLYFDDSKMFNLPAPEDTGEWDEDDGRDN